MGRTVFFNRRPSPPSFLADGGPGSDSIAAVWSYSST
jgi:hypothetical protein